MARRSVNHMHVSFQVNGRRIDYELTEYSDGTFVERGLPDGMAPRPSLVQLYAHAMRPTARRVTSRAANRGSR